MKKTLLTLFLTGFFALQGFCQSSYYYDKGAYLAEGTSVPQLWSRAYSYWTTGEQKGEIMSARMVIYCLLNDIGTPANVSKALQMIDKWYKKDEGICYLGAFIYLPDKYRFVVGMQGAVLSYKVGAVINNSDLKYYQVPQDINKSMKYAKYALEYLLKDNSDYDKTEYLGMMGVCYEFGIGGYSQNYVEATKCYLRSHNRDGYKNMTTACNLIENSDNMTNFMNNVSIIIDRENLPRYVNGLESNNNNYYDYVKVIARKRDELVNRFWSLSADERTSEYLSSSSLAQKLYDECLLDAAGVYLGAGISRSGDPYENMTDENVKAYVKAMNEFPNTDIVDSAKTVYQKHFYDEVKKLTGDYISTERLVDGITKFERLVQMGLFPYPDDWKSFRAAVPERLLRECKSRENALYGFMRDYISSRDYDLQHPGYGKPDYNGISVVYEGYVMRDNPTLLNLCADIKRILDTYHNFDSVGYANNPDVAAYNKTNEEFFTLATAMGFYYDDNKAKFSEERENTHDYLQFRASFPNSSFMSYAHSRYKVVLVCEQNAAALKAALDLRSSSKKDEIKAVLAMPVSPSYAVIIKLLCKKKHIKNHEAYIAAGKEQQYLYMINNAIKDLK